MRKSFYALDLGTTKFCLARFSSGKLQAVSVPAKGMHRGMLSDFELAKKTLTRLVSLAEETFQTDIQSVVVGVSGSHLSCEVQKEKLLFPHTLAIEEKHLELLKNKINARYKSQESEVLYQFAKEYRLDHREILNPMGFTGQELEAQYIFMLGAKSYLKDIVHVCNQSGLKVLRLYPEPLASASICLDGDQKDVGVLFVDIGGGTSDGIIYKGGWPVNVFTINIGGKLMTQDLSRGLRISYEEAEKVKRWIGLLGEGHMRVRLVGGEETDISWQDVYKILGSRVMELCLNLKAHLSSSGYVMVSGGGSEILGLANFMEKILETSVKVLAPKTDLLGHLKSEHPWDGKLSTVAGLLYLETILSSETEKLWKWRKYSQDFWGWVKEFIYTESA